MPPSVALPTHSAVYEKYGHKARRSWTRPVFVPIPGIPNRRLRIPVPNFDSRTSTIPIPRILGRRRTPLLICLACLAVVATVMMFSKNGSGTEWSESWPAVGDPSTLVFQREDLQRIWDWEIRSGHYPSRHSIPKEIGFTTSPKNPAIPAKQRRATPSRYRPPPSTVTTDADTDPLGIGSKRIYLDIQSVPPHVAYPPRPVPGSVADMDIVMKHCDFSEGKYVRDCLEVLRLGGGLDNGQRARRGKMDDWKYIYLEEANSTETQIVEDEPAFTPIPVHRHTGEEHEHVDPNTGLSQKRGAEWEPHLKLPPPLHHHTSGELSEPCDVDNPKLFHMFWAGPFTDKPYLALLSFLFTQNTGIHLQDWPANSRVCRPQFWLWINPGPAAAVPNPNALGDMYESLKSNPWAAPFLHPRFKDVIKFKMWNTTEQLDGVPEIKKEWRALQDSLFNSGGHVINVKHKEAEQETTSEENEEGENGESGSAAPSTSKKADSDDMLNRLGSSSSSTYDRLSVILSDMARFVLCHRFGGIYLDADTIFLRDWEELWGWKGAFAYRWSRLEKYNTAVLRMHRNSALGSFLFRTALKNGLDFHPMTVSRYLADAYLEGLLLRLPDALFDSAWLNTEYYQRDRPPQPYFSEFSEFFDTPLAASAAPQTLGFHGFFKGAYSYHFHNFWWKPFDPTRNWPDLGTRFSAGERQARKALRTESGTTTSVKDDQDPLDDPVDLDKRDLDWSTVMKRTFEAYIRGERPNMYGEWIQWK